MFLFKDSINFSLKAHSCFSYSKVFDVNGEKKMTEKLTFEKLMTNNMVWAIWFI